MSKRITVAMLLLLMQSMVYSAALQNPEGDSRENNDWMFVKYVAGGRLEVREVSASQPTPSIVSNQPEGPEEFSPGFCAVVADLLEKGLAFLKDQAYGKKPFGQQDPASREKNK